MPDDVFAFFRAHVSSLLDFLVGYGAGAATAHCLIIINSASEFSCPWSNKIAAPKLTKNLSTYCFNSNNSAF